MKSMWMALGLAASLVATVGCGDTCGSKAADVAAVAPCTSLRANSDVSVQVQLCATCSETSPSCRGEVVGNEIQLDAAFQECQENSNCPATACESQRITCQFRAPAGAGSYDIVTQNKGSTARKPVQVAASGSTSCTL